MSDRVVHLGPMDRVTVQVRRHPGATLFSVLKDVFAGHGHGVPPLWRETVRRAIPPRAAAVAGPVLAARDCWIPDRIALVENLRSPDFRTLVQDLDETDPHLLAAEVAAYHATATPPGWRRLLDDPAGFLTAYRQLVEAAWTAFAPLWKEADALIDRETERIGIAVVTGGLDGLLAGLGSSLRYETGALRLPHACPTHLTDLGRRPLVMVPLASGPRAHMYGADRGDAFWIGYPVPGLGRLTGRRPRSPQPVGGVDALGAVLGEVRAEILRHLTHRPTVSDLARHLGVGVSTATYHCRQLAAAGLLHRERHGREVRLLPTERGTALTGLLAAPFPPAGR
ncbi:winged helix-turn-helix domain-containing protein [Streptomyces sp. NPDC006339]|uniref:ArsR/SmtB family transcription factor n=1 Tax=Streptomyces sp. NPDC006339 TaxID=3156755 RepID=UPI0033AF2332